MIAHGEKFFSMKQIDGLDRKRTPLLNRAFHCALLRRELSMRASGSTVESLECQQLTSDAFDVG
jgi:hypothetical protein